MEKKEISATDPTIKFGDRHVRLYQREWKSGGSTPYWETYNLKPGQHWRDAEKNPRMVEYYVQTPEGDLFPVGAFIARELMDEGAEIAAFTEQWGKKFVLVNHELIRISEEGVLGNVLDQIRSANSGSLGGLPDVIAVFPDGRVAFREAKRSCEDRLRDNQHKMANLLRKLFGERLDLGVVEWDA